jgi:NitT/TauT family transport system substrate-binding protein
VEPAPEEFDPSDIPGDLDPVDFAVISGPTGVGAAKLLTQIENGEAQQVYNYSIAASNDEITPALINGTLDIAAVATNLAANLNSKTEGGIQVLCINTLGVLYILEKGDTVHEMADLKGKTLYAPSNTKGANPEHILNHLLVENGVEPEEVSIEWLTPQEITVKMTTEDAGICMLPVPAATAVLVKDSGVREAISLSEAWENIVGSPLPMGCVVARTKWVEENPEAVESFLQEYEQSIAFIADEANRAEASEMVASYGITPNAAIAAKAIPQCNLTFITGEEMKDTLESYYRILFKNNPGSIGGSMPYDEFYYGVE